MTNCSALLADSSLSETQDTMQLPTDYAKTTICPNCHETLPNVSSLDTGMDTVWFHSTDFVSFSLATLYANLCSLIIVPVGVGSACCFFT